MIQPKELEKYSSAFTLSDMEIFVFPELFYALVLSNIMSPIIWEWKKDSWFKNIEKKSLNGRVNRLKQFIMDNYVFNLDLETWGLTTQEKEIQRFKDFIDIEILKKSNALFGYEGDKYYFSMDIRRHFGLDKYNDNVIPYWKTETIEAMTAFIHKPQYKTGAGECVSFSSLYAAALFIVARVPLEDIFLMATPLHSQNFIAQGKGIITNNRRILTKNMWFNGTSLSAKARRALENEKITIVTHLSGIIHTIYNEADIDIDAYQNFQDQLADFLESKLDSKTMSKFLRHHRDCQSCFQYAWYQNGKNIYIGCEVIYQYEHTSSNNFSTDSRGALLREIDLDEFHLSPIENRILLNEIEEVLASPKNGLNEMEKFIRKKRCYENCPSMKIMLESFHQFVKIEPQFPDQSKKQFKPSSSLPIHLNLTRDEIIHLMIDQKENHYYAKAALYAYRDMNQIEFKPFLKAAIERNPVFYEALKEKSTNEVYEILKSMSNDSIYPSSRLAQPDEVWNFKQGDGLEKAILFASWIINKLGSKKIKIEIKDKDVFLIAKNQRYVFQTTKSFNQKEINFNGFDSV